MARPSIAAGDGHDPAAARALFQEGRKLAAEKNYEQACLKFEESYRLGSGLGTLLNLADCWEHVGKTASAWSRFLDVAAEAQRTGQTEREKVARSRAATLEPRLSRLTLQVVASTPGLEVRRDGMLVGAATWGVAVPVDPGKHLLEAQAPQKTTWTTTVDVQPNGHAITVKVPPLADLPTSPPDTKAAGQIGGTKPGLAEGSGVAKDGSGQGSGSGAGKGAGNSNTPPDTKDSAGETTAQADAGKGGGSGTARTILGIGLATVGACGIGLGTIELFQYKSKNEQGSEMCPQDACSSPEEKERYHKTTDDAKTALNIGIVGMAAGGAALVGGIVVLLTGSSSKTQTTAGPLQWTPVVTTRGGGIVVGGTW